MQAPQPRAADAISGFHQRAGDPAFNMDMTAEPSWIQPLRSAATMPEPLWQDPAPHRSVGMWQAQPFRPQRQVQRTATTSPSKFSASAPTAQMLWAAEQRLDIAPLLGPQRSRVLRIGASQRAAVARVEPLATARSLPDPLPDTPPAPSSVKGRRVTGSPDSLPGWFILDPPPKRARPTTPFAAGAGEYDC